jgi:hypothetical protein
MDQELIDDIGLYLGFKMWSTRDKSIEYDFPCARDDDPTTPGGEMFIEGKTIKYKELHLLIYKHMHSYHGHQSLYTLNLKTLRPTKNSKIATELSDELKDRIKKDGFSKFLNLFKDNNLTPEDTKCSYEDNLIKCPCGSNVLNIKIHNETTKHKKYLKVRSLENALNK